MIGLDLITGLYLLGAAAIGSLVGGLIRGRQSHQSLNQMDEGWQNRFDNAVRQNEHLNTEVVSLRTSVEAGKATVHKHTLAAARTRTEIESLREKEISLKKNVFQLIAERDALNGKVATSHNAVNIANQRVAEVRAEFSKNQEFYKAQLDTSEEERGVLGRKIKDAKSEQESLNNLLLSARAEYDSVSNLLASAQSRLASLETLEQKVISLESDNAQLKHEAMLATREAESLKKDVAELAALNEQNRELVHCLKSIEQKVTSLESDNAQLKHEAMLATREAESLKRDVSELAALKEQNRELVHCLESMEGSRKQHENDALRYRTQYEQSEQESDTLRFKIGDIEKSWQEMEQAKAKAKKSANGKKKPSTFGLSKPEGDVDDLTEIIGIGKVFERTLHDLGVYHFRQIAAFGPIEIARINSELKEFKGRVEHDDWIGQAKDLHFRKYGEK